MNEDIKCLLKCTSIRFINKREHVHAYQISNVSVVENLSHITYEYFFKNRNKISTFLNMQNKTDVISRKGCDRRSDAMFKLILNKNNSSVHGAMDNASV